MFDIVWWQIGLQLLFLQQSSPSHCLIWIEMFCAAMVTHPNSGILHDEWIAFHLRFVLRKNLFQNCALATLLTSVAKCNSPTLELRRNRIELCVHLSAVTDNNS